MSFKNSAKKMFGLICTSCGSSETEYRCTLCHRKFCKSCVNEANRAVENDLKAVRNASLLAGNATVTGLVLNLLARISDDMSLAYCPKCSIKVMNRLASGKRLGNMGEIAPCCKRDEA